MTPRIKLPLARTLFALRLRALGAACASGRLAALLLAWCGLARAFRAPRVAGWLLGAGLAVAVLSKGPAAAIAPGAVALAAPLVSPAWRGRGYAFALLAAAL